MFLFSQLPLALLARRSDPSHRYVLRAVTALLAVCMLEGSFGRGQPVQAVAAHQRRITWCRTSAGFSVPYLYLTSGGGHQTVLFISECALRDLRPDVSTVDKALNTAGLVFLVDPVVYAAAMVLYWRPLQEDAEACGNVGAYLVNYGPFLRPQPICSKQHRGHARRASKVMQRHTRLKGDSRMAFL